MKVVPALAIGALALVSLTSCAAGGSGSSAPSAGSEDCEDIDLTAAPKEPTTIRIGHGAAAEEPFWLMVADGSTNDYEGTWYTMETFPFRGTAERLTAYQAGDLDALMITPQVQIQGTARGALDLYTIATVMREAEPGSFSTAAIVRDDGKIKDVDDLEGKTIAIVDEGAQPDFIARQALRGAGLDPSSARFVVLPYPSQEEALRSGQVDVAIVPEPFFSVAVNKGGVKKLFDAADITDFSYDLLTVSFDKEFVEKNLGAVCAWAADYAESMKAYIADPDGSKKKLVGTDFVTLPEAVYLSTGDYARPEGGVVDPKGTSKMIDAMVDFGILEKRDQIDVSRLIREGVTLGN